MIHKLSEVSPFKKEKVMLRKNRTLKWLKCLCPLINVYITLVDCIPTN